MLIEKLLNSQICKAKEKGWDKIYIAVDVHGTIIKPDYKEDSIKVEFYPWANYALKYMTRDPRFCLILYTCSYPYQIDEYLAEFEKFDIHFDYVNENPEVISGEEKYGYYVKKFYRNITLDDTAGFFPDRDWCAICMEFRNLPNLLEDDNTSS